MQKQKHGKIDVLRINAKPKDDYDIVMPTVSRSEGRQLSPFVLGPVKLPRPIKGAANTFTCLENAWQYAKAYRSLGHVDDGFNLTPAFYNWWEVGCNSRKPERYPAGKGACPAFSVFGRLRLSYVAARKAIYAPIYASLVEETKLFRELQREYRKGARILLLDYDASYEQSELQFTTIINMRERKMGHAYVLREHIVNTNPFWYKTLIL